MTERQRVVKKIRFIAEHSVLMAQEWKDVMVQAAEMLEKDGENETEDNEKSQP
ncbi:MAG: hypothetical protein J6Y48_20740 [Clostridia bacterium]|nr:hypothetical protein [Clostridia bacterium]MBP5729504.1 hypothetical protein [Clostridia bacterium]